MTRAQIDQAVTALSNGEVIAYPTEYCFGLGCDPRNESAIAQLLDIKRRGKEQGVILIASDLAQIKHYANFETLERADQIIQSWPGPNTWLLPVDNSVSTWVRGKHPTLAMRIPDHPICQALCEQFGHAIVSTSANRHGQDALQSYAAVYQEFGQDLACIIDAEVGGASAASTIRHALSGQQIR